MTPKQQKQIDKVLTWIDTHDADGCRKAHWKLGKADSPRGCYLFEAFYDAWLAKLMRLSGRIASAIEAENRVENAVKCAFAKC